MASGSQNANVQYMDLIYNDLPHGPEAARFGFQCPRKAEHRCEGLLIRIPPKTATVHPSWILTGDPDQPTVRPSINCGQCGAHGYITDGKWADC